MSALARRMAWLAFCTVIVILGIDTGSAAASARTAEREITAHDLATLRDLAAFAVSPDGKWVAFQVRQADPARNAYDLEWRVAPVGGGVSRRIAGGGEPILSHVRGIVTGAIRSVPPAWSPDSTWIGYLRQDGGRTQVWRARRDGKVEEQVTHNDGDARALAVSADGERILFVTELSRPQIDAALAREGRTGFLFGRRILPGYGGLAPVLPEQAIASDASPSYPYTAVVARQTWVSELRSRRERQATQAEQPQFAALLVASSAVTGRPRKHAAESRAGALAWTEARDPARQGGFAPLTAIAQLNAHSEPLVCESEECTGQKIDGLWWRDNGEVVFARREGLRLNDTALYAWQPQDGTIRFILRTSDKLTGGLEWACAIALDRLICFHEQTDYPRRLVGVDLVNGTVQTLYDPNPSFAAFDLGRPPQHLQIRAPSGVEAEARLVLPPRRRQNERLPLIIATYRCSGFLRGGIPGDEYPIHPLAAQGFAVLCVDMPDMDYRRMETLGFEANAAWARGVGNPVKHRILDTLGAAIERLDREGVIDPRRIGITGLSYGAEMAGFALANMPGLTTAIASSGLGQNPFDYYLSGPAGREIFAAWGIGAPYETEERWRSFGFSPNAGRVRAPILLNVADHEMLLAVQPVMDLEDAGRAVEMYVFPDEYHIKWQPAHRLAIYNRNIDWMNFWLRGVEDPAPEKAEQYERWRAMRVRQCELFKGDDAPWYCRR